MLQFILCLLIVLHGLVHLLYFGQSVRRFELRPGMVWPDGSWAFSRFRGDQLTRNLAGISCVLVAIGFVLGGAGLLIGQAWWRLLVGAAAVFSCATFILFWDGSLRRLNDQGAIGILINLAILVVVLFLRWPSMP